MNDAVAEPAAPGSRSRGSRLARSCRSSLLAGAVAWLVVADPLRGFDNGAPPVENLTFERTILDDDGIHLLVRAGGSEPMTIAQVQVDDAYWHVHAGSAGRDRARRARRGSTCRIPGCSARRISIKVVTNTGATFEHEIAVAVPTPDARRSASFGRRRCVGIFVGIVPVAIGLMFYPGAARRRAARPEFPAGADRRPARLPARRHDRRGAGARRRGGAALPGAGDGRAGRGARASCCSWRSGAGAGAPSGLALAIYIALGIGLHNLGEGLAIGAAFAAGAAGLGTFLVLGFTLHNVTEGIGIAAPMLRLRPRLHVFAGLALLAGGPAVIGMWLGQPRHRAAMGGAGARRRRGRDPAGHRRDRRPSAA